jgi:hypothetical protein
MTKRYDKYLLTDNFPDDGEAVRLIMDMLKATVRYPQAHAAGFDVDVVWNGTNRTGYSYFLGSSGGPSDPSFENYRKLSRDITPILRELEFITSSKYPNIKSGFWQFTPRALDWYRENSGPSDDEVRKKIGRIIAQTDPTNNWSYYQAAKLAEEVEISPERLAREISVLTGGGFLERRKASGSDLGLIRFALPKGVLWAAADFPPIGTFGQQQTTVTVSLHVEVRTIIEQVQSSGLDPGLLEQYELRLRRVEEELQKPDGQGRLQTVHDLVETANGSKDLLIPTVGFLATHADKIKTFAEGIGNLLT